MKSILLEYNTYILRLDKGEELIAKLVVFCNQEGIDAGFFTGIGATNKVVLAWYDVDTKEYLEKELQEKLEVTSITGNVARKKDESIVHAHGTFSDREMVSYAGHIKELVVAATLELTFVKMKGRITKEHSEEIGLNLMK